ncbi:MAG: hypothetical protein JWN08_2166, partial [Frankiales bacterium]|nr:hypothetical protein [Frankiales bacterium]
MLIPRLLVAALVLGAAAPAAAARLVPEQVPDRLPLVSETLTRAGVVLAPRSDRTPSVKVVDGRVDDWAGAPTLLGGTSRYDAGELVHTDYLFDDWGADDGEDAQRLQLLGPAYEAEERTRRLDQLFQAAGDQFDAPRPVGTADHYGDGQRGQADLREVRFAARGGRVSFLARTTTLTDARALGVLLLVDRGGAARTREVGFGTGLTTSVFDTAVLLRSTGATARDLATGRPV